MCTELIKLYTKDALIRIHPYIIEICTIHKNGPHK